MKDKIKNPVGRPAMKPDDKRKTRTVKMNDDEWKELQARAAVLGLSASDYIRQRTLGAD